MNGENLYGGEGPTLAEPAPEAAPTEEQSESTPTFLINKEVCPGMEVGDEIRARIVAVHEKEYECEYVKGAEGEEAPEAEPMAPPAPEGGIGAPEAGGLYGG